MIPGAFDYHRPASVDEAVRLLAQYGDDGRVIAGGHSLIPMMKLRLAQPAHLVDIGGIGGLAGVREDGPELVIGALTTQHDLLASDLVQRRCPLLHETALLIADPQVRYRGTIGGNVANGDPGNDMPAVMQCLDATYVVQGPSGERRIKAREFYEAAYFTALKADEILIGIRIPTPPAGHGWAYEKQKRKVGDYATAAAAAILVARCRPLHACRGGADQSRPDADPGRDRGSSAPPSTMRPSPPPAPRPRPPATPWPTCAAPPTTGATSPA